MKTLRAAEIIDLIDALPYDAGAVLALKSRLRREASVKEIIMALQSTQDIGHQYVLCDVLGRRRAKSAVPLMIAYINDPLSKIRSLAAETLGKTRSSKACDVFLTHFEKADEEMPVRHNLAAGLGSCGCREGIPLLIPELKSPDRALRYVTAWALGELKAREAIEPLRDVLDGELEKYERYVMESALQKILESSTTA